MLVALVYPGKSDAKTYTSRNRLCLRNSVASPRLNPNNSHFWDLSQKLVLSPQSTPPVIAERRFHGPRTPSYNPPTDRIIGVPCHQRLGCADSALPLSTLRPSFGPTSSYGEMAREGPGGTEHPDSGLRAVALLASTGPPSRSRFGANALATRRALHRRQTGKPPLEAASSTFLVRDLCAPPPCRQALTAIEDSGCVASGQLHMRSMSRLVATQVGLNVCATGRFRAVSTTGGGDRVERPPLRERGEDFSC